jgi:hypothetical protein
MRILGALMALIIIATACSSTGGDSEVDENKLESSGAISQTVAAESTAIPFATAVEMAPTSSPIATPVPSATPTPVPVYGPDLIVNGNFEDGTGEASGWDVVSKPSPDQTVEWIEQGTHDGTRALKLVSPGDATDWIRLLSTGTIPIEPDSKYLFTAWVRTEKAGVFFSSWNFYAETSADAPIAGGSSGQIAVTETDWWELSAIMFPRGEATGVRIGIALAIILGRVGLTPGDLMTLYVDNVSMRKIIEN